MTVSRNYNMQMVSDLRVKAIKPGVQIFLMTAFEINDNEFKRLL